MRYLGGEGIASKKACKSRQVETFHLWSGSCSAACITESDHDKEHSIVDARRWPSKERNVVIHSSINLHMIAKYPSANCPDANEESAPSSSWRKRLAKGAWCKQHSPHDDEPSARCDDRSGRK